MQTGVIVAVVLSSCSAFACINGTEELAPSVEGTKALNASRKALKEQKYQEAITKADAALRLGVPRHQKKWIFRVKGEALIKLDRPKEALVFLNTVSVEFSDDAVFLSRLAQAEVQTGNPMGGKRLEGLATDGMMPDANAWYWLARSRQTRGEDSAALAAAQKAAELSPADGPTQKLLNELGPAAKTM